METLYELATVDNIIKVAQAKGYIINKGEKNYHINIWFIRDDSETTAGKFDDLEIVFYYDINRNEWVSHVFPCTTEPGQPALLKPLTSEGTAILKPQQVLKGFKLGMHQGKYEALVQNKPFAIVRDFNKNTTLDCNTPDYDEKKIRHDKYGNKITDYYLDGELVFRDSVGWFGINNHRASKVKLVDMIGWYSAGCQVQRDCNRFENEFLPLVKKQIPYYGEEYDWALITRSDLTKVAK